MQREMPAKATITKKIDIFSRYCNKMKLPANTFGMLTLASVYTIMCNTRRVCFAFIFPPSFTFGFTKPLKNSSDFKWNGKCSGKQERRTRKKGNINDYKKRNWQVDGGEREYWQSSTAINP